MSLQDTEAQLRAVLDTAVDAIITIDSHGQILSLNPAIERMFGYVAAELIGQNVKLLMPSPYREEHDTYLSHYLETGRKHIIGIGREVQGKRKDGTVFPIDLAVSEVRRGELFTGIIRDTSDRKLAEARAREADRMATIGTLAAGLGHDMNNVLLPVRAHLNALRTEVESTASSVRHVDRIQRGVQYLQQLADALHYLALDPDREDVEEGASSLHAWWAQTGALLSKSVPKGVKVTATLSSELPEVAIAAHALTQAVLNLIVNAGEAISALRASSPGRVRVSAERSQDGSAVRLSVKDNGTGMSEETKCRAFDMFFTTRPRGLGTGLGLALVRKVVERSGGAIEVESTLGKGTTVTLILPTVPASRGDSAPAHVIVSLSDGRSASVVSTLITAFGGVPRIEDKPGSAAIWVVEPKPDRMQDAHTWRESNPKGLLVLFGSPPEGGRAKWHALNPEIIDRPEDILAIRQALGDVIAAMS